MTLIEYLAFRRAAFERLALRKAASEKITHAALMAEIEVMTREQSP
jgi:hypothetical protein